MHGSEPHVLEWRGKDCVDLVGLIKADIAGRLAWLVSVVDRLVAVVLLIVALLDHVLQDLSGHLGVGSHGLIYICSWLVLLLVSTFAEPFFINYF